MESTHSPLSQFISEEQIQPWFGPHLPHEPMSDGTTPLPECFLYSCKYHENFFTPAFFRSANIVFPDSLSNAVRKRQAEFAAGRYCAAKALTHIGIKDAHVPIGKDRSPVWPRGVVGSISHSKTRVAAIASLDSTVKGLGVDIEEVIPTKTANDIQGQIIFGKEVERLQHPTMTKDLIFTLIFSLKESFFKAAYPQVKRYFGFEAVALETIDSDNQQLVFTLREDLHDSLYKGRQIYADYRLLAEDQVVTRVILK